MDTAVHLAQIIVAVGVIFIVLTQSRGGGLGQTFGGSDSSIHHTRRGIERTLFHFTIGAVVVFVVLSIFATVFL